MLREVSGGRKSDRLRSGRFATGLHPELVAERNPYSLTDGQALPVRLLYEDEPLGSAQK